MDEAGTGAGAVATIVGLTVALVTPLVTILTLLFTKGIEAWRIKYSTQRSAELEEKKLERSAELEDRKHDDDQADKAIDLLIRQMEARQSFLEGELNHAIDKYENCTKLHNAQMLEAHKAHSDCLIEQERLRGDLKALQVHVERLWSHDKRNQEQIKENLKSIAIVEQRGKTLAKEVANEVKQVLGSEEAGGQATQEESS